MEFLIAIIVLGMIAIVGVKVNLQAKKQEILTYYSTQNIIQLENTLLQIANLLDNAIDFKTTSLGYSFKNGMNSYRIILQDKDLLINNTTLLNNIEEFGIVELSSHFLLKLCIYKVCARRVVLSYGDLL